MSTILRALRRLEQEKDDATRRAHLRDEVVAPAAPRRRRVWPAWTAAGVFALGLVATAAFVLRSPAPEPLSPSPESSPVPSLPPVAAEPMAVVSPPAAVVAAEPATAPIPAAPEPLAPAAPSPELPAQVQVQAAPEPVYEEALEVPASPEPADDVAVTVVRTALPDFVLQRTIWHPRPERREAHVSVAGIPVIQVLHEGDSLGPLRVETITPSAAVFSNGDVTIHRRIGEK